MANPQNVDRAIFREAEDGAVVFFPWGLSHRGYRLPDEAAKQKASRAVSLLIGCTVGIGTWTAYRLQPLLESGASEASEIAGMFVPPAAALAAVILGYAWRVARLVESATPSDLQVTREEQLREAAGLVDPRQVALIGVVLAALSGLLVWLQPNAWWLGALGVGLGLLTVLWSVALRRAARS